MDSAGGVVRQASMPADRVHGNHLHRKLQVSENCSLIKSRATSDFSKSRLHVNSMLALLLFSAAALAQQPAPTPSTRLGRSYSYENLPKTPPPPGPKGPSPVTFTDIVAQTKINFRHQGSPTSTKYLLETMGGGVAMFDYDNDGRMDLFFTNGAAIKDSMTKNAPPDKTEPRF